MMDNPSQTEIAVVVPLYNEIENLDELHRRLFETCSKLSSNFALVYIDDSSSDGTSEALELLRQKNRVVNIISMARNFGQPAAIMAGLSHTQAKSVVLLDGDLQDPPELIEDLYQKWLDGGQVVIAQRRSRQERGLRGLALRSFHKVFAFLSDSNIPRNTGTFCLLDQQAVHALCSLPESHRFFPGMRAWIGFEQAIVEYDRAERLHGEPKQTWSRLFRYALDGIFSFSFKPLRLMTVSGFLICALSVVLACWFVGKRLLGVEDALTGFTTLTCAILGLGGFQLVGMGILGEYIGRIYEEVKRRPANVIAKIRGEHIQNESTTNHNNEANRSINKQAA